MFDNPAQAVIAFTCGKKINLLLQMWAHAVFPDAVAPLGLKLGSLRTSLHVDCQKINK